MSLSLPGDAIGPSSSFRPGPGTHLHASQLYASLLGPVARATSTSTDAGSSSSNNNTRTAQRKTRPNLSISAAPFDSRAVGNSTGAFATSNTTLPEVNSVVLGRVVRLRPREAVVEILVVGETAVAGGFQGVVRAQDVRATEKDRVKVGEMFRVGDIVRGLVISLGDQSSYYLSTAKNELGVIMATSEQGNAMYPISWREFKDPETGKTEARKVAKPL
ncbi:MAG: exosome 3'-_5 exonuclease subunit ski4 (Csl4) [Bathelium mastoideum]|nr:MAG: exosome 3'->5 exonuclease subunit ski4 (Csl4) [Bathelium mastoideum]